MTITLAWLRRNKDTTELLFASDSRLRSYGAMDQSQKLFRLDRGDCCLGFSGDTHIAYPLFIQASAALNNFVRTRTRAADVTDVAANIGQVLNNLADSWDLPKAEKNVELAATNIVFGGWSWKHKRFDIGVFRHDGKEFSFHHRTTRIGHPWRENARSLVFVGDYEREYKEGLMTVLEARHGKQTRAKAKYIDFDYEPVEALNSFLKKVAKDRDFPAVGGGPQVVKVYSYGNSLPIVVRRSAKEHLLLGRKLFTWEKTEYPILDLTKKDPKFIYPMSDIPLPQDCAAPQNPVGSP
jgi:hypothetical protein